MYNDVKSFMFGRRSRSGTYRAHPLRCHLNRLLVVIHSSSHLGSHRGVVERVKMLLGNNFEVHIEAIGGRKWDEKLIKNFHDMNQSGHTEPILHIVLLGDNDVRGTKITERVNPFIKKFGESMRRHKDPESKFNVFVNGLLPFPMHNRPDSHELFTNYHRYTMEMYGLIHYSPEIHFVPMRESMMEFCEKKGVMARQLFGKDKVHLTQLGEEFLIGHLTRQAHMYRAATGYCVHPEDLTFFQNVASLHKPKVENLRIMIKEYRVNSVLTKISK
jgi:hypothetical protein